MATTAQHIEARDDIDLQRRLIAAAEQANVPNAQSAVASALGKLVGLEIEVYGETTTIADVYANAAAVRREHLADEKALPPGQNPNRVTDEILVTAVLSLLT